MYQNGKNSENEMDWRIRNHGLQGKLKDLVLFSLEIRVVGT